MKKITTLVLALTFILGLSYLSLAADEKKGDAMKAEDMMDTVSDADADEMNAVMNETVNDDVYGDEDSYGDEDVDTMPVPAKK